MQLIQDKLFKLIIAFIIITALIPSVQSSTTYYPPSANVEKGFNETSSGSSSSISDTQIYFSMKGGAGDGDTIYYVTKNTVDLRNISYIEVEWKGTFGAVTGAAVFGISNSKMTDSFTVNTTRTATFTTTKTVLDVSTYYGDYYIKVGGYTKAAGFADENKIWVYNITSYPFPSCWPSNATSISTSLATLNGRLVEDSNRSCTCGFWVGNTTTSGSSFEQNVTASGTYTTGQDFSKAISGLTAGKYYYVRAWCYDAYDFNISTNESYFLTLPDSPTNFRVTGIGAQTLTLSWTNATIPTAMNKSVLIRYSKTNYPSSITDGTFGANESTWSYATIVGLDEESTYYFSAWTWINGSGSPTLEAYSSTYATTYNATAGGVYNIIIRHENETDGVNEPVNLAQYWGPHRLIIHYEDETDYVMFYNYGLVESTISGYFASNASGNFTIEVNKSITYLEFHWNDSDNRTYRCNRIIIPFETNNTFYIKTDYPIYGEGTALPNQSLVIYAYSFLDETGKFTVDNNAYATIFTYNSNGGYMQIHCEYIDAGQQIHPWLIYQKKYFIGVHSDVLNIERVGIATTTDVTSVEIRIPYQENITYNFLDIINLQIGWFDDGFYANYQDTTGTTSLVWFDVYYFDNGTHTGHTENATVSTYNFTYTTAEGCNTSVSYYFIITATVGGVGASSLYRGTYTIQIPIIAGYHMSISVSDLDALITLFFGPSPLYNVDNPLIYVRWTYILLFGIAFLILMTFGRLNAFLGMLGCGLTLALGAFMISGIGWIFVIAVLLMVLAIIGLIGGVERRQM